MHAQLHYLSRNIYSCHTSDFKMTMQINRVNAGAHVFVTPVTWLFQSQLQLQDTLPSLHPYLTMAPADPAAISNALTPPAKRTLILDEKHNQPCHTMAISVILRFH